MSIVLGGRATPFDHIASRTRRRRRLVFVAVLSLLATVLVAAPGLAATDPCTSGNAIACENSKTGNPETEWDVSSGAGSPAIQGFATQMSVTPGSTVQFKIKAVYGYTVKIYRLGWYGGLGARLWGGPLTVASPAVQPACVSDSSTQNYDCGTWSVSTSWAVPSNAVSGVYVAHLVQTDGSDSQIVFVVRDDTSHSDAVFKTSDATWQAYNDYGGADFYTAPTSLTAAQPRAFKISYNRPVATRGANSGRDFLFSNEYPTLRFLERNGVDLSYTTDVDVSAGTTVLTQHKAFLSVGHDEYWSGPERANVTAARDAGVNLMFLSGNEVYWRTRYEPSIDGSATPSRTLVCYKDSWEPAPIDPDPAGTGTWRDPRFKASPNGNNPENGLTGTLYMSNFTDLALTVPAAQGKARFWRNTSVASLSPGTTATLAPHTVGYESDEDVDNGARPAGLVDLSTTTGTTPQEVQNAAGTVVASGTTTHHLTLYRAASGALVFGAGTVQWGWGLDQDHDGGTSDPADPRMQQATLNMLSDMGVQPSTLMAGLAPVAKSTDTTPPVVTVTTPSSGASLPNGTTVTVTGTASDVGGIVAAVEVSLDGGATYHRATGTTSWTYTGVVNGLGTRSILARASDDSANLSTPVSTSVSVRCPCSLFGLQAPRVPSYNDSSAVELGVKFVPQTDGFVSAIRFYKGSGNTGSHLGTLWTASGQVLGTGTFADETASGWQTLTLPAAVPVSAGTTYVASYYAPSGHYASDASFFAGSGWTAPPLSAPGGLSVTNGVFSNGHAFPASSYNASNYWVDVLFSLTDTTPPTVTARTPIPASTSNPWGAHPSVTFGAAIAPASLSMNVVDAAGRPVAGTAALDDSNRTAVFTPSGPLAYGATYTVSVSASSPAGVAMATPDTWGFTTAPADPVPGICPCQIWPDSAAPATASASDTASVELGVKFSVDTPGRVTALRFYKGTQNLGTHTGSLWSNTGALLATVTYEGESTAGWQTAQLSSPVDVSAGTTYIASYHAPAGGYAFTSGGLSVGVDSGPLHAQSGGAVYTYGTGAPLTPSSANYWVDVVYAPTDVAPTVTATTPGAGSTNVSVSTSLSVTFSGSVRSGSAQIAVTAPDGSSVPGTTTAGSSTTATFSPSASLAAAATYTATVSGASSLSGTTMQPFTFSFTTAGACPCTLFSSTSLPATVDAGDGSGIEVGTSFTSSVPGQVSGVRFYKAAANTGTHTGTLWSASGAVLATGTFTGESSSGWQTLTFPQAVAVSAGTSYVVSYYAPVGHYSITSHFFDTAWSNGPLTVPAGNGLYRYGASSGFPTGTFGNTNYWVDPVFGTGPVVDTTPPRVVSTVPLAGSTSQSTTAGVVADFDEDLDPASVVMTVTGPTGAGVAGTVGYDTSTDRVSFAPTSALARGMTYTASVRASDVAGNAMAAPRTWSFTTAQPDPTPGVCPCSLWTDATTPAVLGANDPADVELGTAFTTDTAGSVTGVRFYKGPQNTGLHTVSLWTTDGTRLATATVGAESSSGWQTGSFSTPVPVTTGTTYVVSYLAPVGAYSMTAGGLSGAVDTAPLHTLSTGGRYVYGGGYPASTSSSNYWVDPVLVTTAAAVPASTADTTSPTVSQVGVAPSGTGATVTWTTDEVSSSTVSYGLTTTLGSSATGTSGAAHSVALAGLTSGSTYYYRVSSADTAGNRATWPAASSPPATFRAADVTPPVISSLSVAISGTTATVTWTTDEPSTSSISFGVGTSLGSTASGATGTAHSVTLSGLTEGATYAYRVSSADSAGNLTTSPGATADPSTFLVPDRTPPTVSTVTASGSGTSAAVTWTTNESSTSVVTYGASAASLSSTATGAAGTGHSVALTGLTPNTRYYYRVTSADAAGNSTTWPGASAAPASYVPTVAAVVQTTAADFGAGTLTGSYISQNGDGEISQKPTTGVEFDGTTLPTSVTSAPLVTGGTTVVGGGRATLSGSQVTSVGTATAPKSLETAVTSRLTSSMRLGFGTTTGSVFAGFGVNASGQLVAIANDGVFFASTTVLTTVNPALAHRYRVDWTSSTSVSFVVDGTTVLANVSFWPSVALNAVLRDATVDTTPLVLDWFRASPFDPSSTYVSKVLDAGATVGWDTLSSTGTVPAGTTRTIQVRSGTTAVPGAGWTGWTTVASSGGSINQTARYLQYQVLMTSSGNRFVTSTTDSVTVAFHVL